MIINKDCLEQYKNKVIQGDCLEVMKSIPDKSIDMILADLPYGTTACKWDTIIPFEPLWEQYKRIIKDNGAIVLTASQPFTSKLVMSKIKDFKYSWVWNKKSISNPQLAKFQPLKCHEDILVFSNKTHKYFPQGLIDIENINIGKKSVCSDNEKLGHIKRRSDYIQTKTNYPKSIQLFPRESNVSHPTQKPVALFEYLIKTYTNEGDIVLDNVAGSGTTGVACKNTNRNYILIEKEPEYIEIINKRIANTKL